MRFFVAALLFFQVFFVQIAFCQEMTLSGIHGVMQKIFDEHVSQKKMNEELMNRSVEQFINQFDPDKSYLLYGEAEPYFTLPQSKLNALVDEYNRNDYQFFDHLTAMFQRAIGRARGVREKNSFSDMQAVNRFLISFEKMSQGSKQKEFAKTEEELEKRAIAKMALSIKRSEQQAVQEKVTASFAQLVNAASLALREVEDGYLYQDLQGRPVPVKEQEDLLASHILKAMTSSLDAHSSFLNPQEAYELKMRLQKSFDGVGIILEDQGGSFVVTKLVPDSPAAKCNQIILGDQLLTIDGSSVSGMELEAVMERLQGKTGSYVSLCFKRGGVTPRMVEVNLQREKLVLEEGRVDAGFVPCQGGIIGTIVLHSFYQGEGGVSSEEDVRKALTELEKKGRIRGLVLDLRDNRGGFLMQAVKVAGLFIKSGVIVVAKENNGKETFFRDTDPSVLYSGPLVILTSKATASAAEIVAQALKDYGAAVVVGDPHTYGKGSIQMQTVTSNTDSPSMKVTIGTYYSVSGESTQMKGVVSDIVVPSVYFNKKIGEEYLNFPIAHDSISPAYNDSLADVDPEMKDWYLKYYKPYLQEKETGYRKYILQLQQKSAARMAENKEYQDFLEGRVSQGVSPEKLQKDVWSLQVQEAVNVAKDLADLSGGHQ